MKSPQELLIAFMWKKQELLPVKEPVYFTEDDANAIRKWSKTKANKALSTIIKNLTDINVWAEEICPFCVVYPLAFAMDGSGIRCQPRCEYGKKHGFCATDDNSDYIRLCENENFSMLAWLDLDRRAELISILKGE